jgi:hypothetical protein
MLGEGKRTSLRDFTVHLRKLDEYDVPESLLRVVGDTDGTDVSSVVELDVFVVRGVSGRCRDTVSASGSLTPEDRSGGDPVMRGGTHCWRT